MTDDPDIFQGVNNFDFEFTNMAGDLGETEESLRREAEKRLVHLAEGHSDVTGAAVALEREEKDSQTGYQIRARVVVYSRPEYFAGVEKDQVAMTALKNALSKVERQVRDKRNKLRDRDRKPKDDTRPPDDLSKTI